eukprot:TRINITY_DN358_c0_g3_i1.p1 TRINITY_DN358_c0_g3~~TRINITY_DN358_c0_g3_i1.p1  ORF type:complete len:279 (+),score=63.44 TRINITY_DN358_c0_g3_i1:75-911(+)
MTKQFLVALLFISTIAMAWADDFDVFPFPKYEPYTRSFDSKKVTGHYKSNNQKYTGYLAIVNDPKKLHIFTPEGGCGSLEKVSKTSKHYHCAYATNAGFFMGSGSENQCMGGLVSNGTVIRDLTHSESNALASFGITMDNKFVFGHIKGHFEKFKFQEFVQGFGMAVRKGKNNVPFIKDGKSKGVFLTKIAPRTAVGILKNGKPFLFQVDGMELFHKGALIKDIAEVMLEFGAYYAVMLDGGGSSVSVKGGSVISYPTCWDGPIKCERKVNTITCIEP